MQLLLPKTWRIFEATEELSVFFLKYSLLHRMNIAVSDTVESHDKCSFVFALNECQHFIQCI
jgi:hypothetical protein